MPSIKKNTEQEIALQEITEALAAIKNLNHVLVPGWAGDASIAFVVGRGKAGTVRVPFSGEDVRELNRLVSIAGSYKSRLVKDIKAKATKYQIRLDDEDIALMNGEADDTCDEEPQPLHTPVMPEPTTPSTTGVEPLDVQTATPATDPPFTEVGPDVREEDLRQLLADHA